MTTRHATITAIGTAVAATLLDPARVVMAALVLRRVRRANPELFDGPTAAAIVNALAEEAASS